MSNKTAAATQILTEKNSEKLKGNVSLTIE